MLYILHMDATTDISETGLETLIMRHMTGEDWLRIRPRVQEFEVREATPKAGWRVRIRSAHCN